MTDEFDRFREKLVSEQRKILDNLLQKHSDDCKKLFVNEIQRDREHSTIVNICAYAFSMSGPLAYTGYRFITIDPLYKFRGEKNNKIFDLVIYNRETKRAILVECKSSIGNPLNSVLTPLRDQIENVTKHKKELEDEIGGEIEDIEL